MSKRPYRVPFWERKTITTAGCWEWVGSKRRYGYGQVYFNGKSAVKAHRVAWELAYGPVSDGLCVLHKCDNTACINPDHLFLGSQLDNIRDMNLKGRHGKTGKPKLMATCHPKLPNHAFGLCKVCRQRQTRKAAHGKTTC